MAETIEEVIVSFVPRTRNVPPAVWHEIEEDVRSVVRSSSPASPTTAQHLMVSYTRFSAWALAQGRSREVEDLLRPEVVEHYVSTRTDLALASAGTLRSNLRLLGRRCTRNAPWMAPAPTYPTSQPALPYNDDECEWLLACVSQQATPHRQRTLGTLLGLCLGAGLASPEVVAARVSDIHTSSISPDQLSIHLPNRTVPIRARYRTVLEQTIARLDPDALILRDQPLPEVQKLWDLLQVCDIPAQLRPITVTRLRTTWSHEALKAPVPLPTVIAAHGSGSAKFIQNVFPLLLSNASTTVPEAAGLHHF